MGGCSCSWHFIQYRWAHCRGIIKDCQFPTNISLLEASSLCKITKSNKQDEETKDDSINMTLSMQKLRIYNQKNIVYASIIIPCYSYSSVLENRQSILWVSIRHREILLHFSKTDQHMWYPKSKDIETVSSCKNSLEKNVSTFQPYILTLLNLFRLIELEIFLDLEKWV